MPRSLLSMTLLVALALLILAATYGSANAQTAASGEYDSDGDGGSVPSSIRVRSQAFFGGLSGLVVTRPVAPTASLCELLR